MKIETLFQMCILTATVLTLITVRFMHSSMHSPLCRCPMIRQLNQTINFTIAPCELPAKQSGRFLPEQVQQLQLHHLPSICANTLCQAELERRFQNSSNPVYPVPAIRHVAWKGDSISEYFVEQLQSWYGIHPHWTVVLWRDQDMDLLVQTHYPGLLAKFKSLPNHIMRVDMIRYIMLYKYGGTYADLDYTLVRSLDKFRRYHAVVTREPEAHSILLFGFTWPLKLAASPAFLMSSPGHAFFEFVSLQLGAHEAKQNLILEFAGPVGLSAFVEKYQARFPFATHGMEAVYIPPSYSFYPYPFNKLNGTKSSYRHWRFRDLIKKCKNLMSSRTLEAQLLRNSNRLMEYCSDVNNMDVITDIAHPIYAIHDMTKSGAAYDTTGVGKKFYTEKLVKAKVAFPKILFGSEFMQKMDNPGGVKSEEKKIQEPQRKKQPNARKKAAPKKHQGKKEPKR